MLSDHEKNLHTAARAYRNGLSMQAAAIRYGVSRTTLQRYIDNSVSHCKASLER